MKPQTPKSILRATTMAALAWLTASDGIAATVFETTFASDVIVSATTAAGTLTPTSANWYLMSNKDARGGSSVNGTGGLTISHTSSTSAVAEATARLTTAPIELRDVNDYIEASGTFYTDRVLNFVIGLYNSGGVEPLVTGANGTTLLANSALVSSITGPVGGTLGWKGYRAQVSNAYSGTAPNQVTIGSTTGSIQARQAQTGASMNYQAYDLLSVGTGGFNSPTAISIGTVPASATSLVWANGFAQEYRFTYRITRSSSTAFLIAYTIKDATDAVLFSTSGTTTAATALPSAITSAFDSFAFGMRNNSVNAIGSVSTISLTQFKVTGQNADIARVVTPPQNQNLVPGQAASLTVSASGAGTLTYQWFKDTFAIPGATNASLPIVSASSADIGSYTVVVRNAFGFETSAAANVNVVEASAPVFTLQPENQSVNAGTTLTLASTASGAPTPTFQWYKNNTLIPGATLATYTVPSVTTDNAGEYKVIATNSQGSVTSDVVTITIVTATPSISAQPAPVTVNVGAAINLEVTATGIPTPTYQWFKNNVAIDGATAATYTITSATTADIGNYSVDVINSIGTLRSADAGVTVTVVPPSVTTPPGNVTVVYGNSTTLTAAYAGSLPRTYQWYRNSTLIPGATGSSYTITSATLADAGDYYVVVSNEDPTNATSATAVVTVLFANESAVLNTDFTTSAFHNADAPITATSTSWWVLSSKNNALSSTIGDDAATLEVVEARPLTLKFNSTTGSSIVETAARFSSTPVSLANSGDYLRLTANLRGKNLRILAFGLFNSGGINPFPLWGSPTVDIIAAGASNNAAVGKGTQGWVGYRSSIQATSSAGDVGTRPAQTTSTSNRGNELLMPPNSTGAAHGEPAGVQVGTVPSLGVNAAFVNDTDYTLVYTIARSGSDQYTINYQLFAGLTATGSPLYASGATTTAAGTLPSEVTQTFDAVAVGFRNMDTTVIPEITISSLRIDLGTAVSPVAPSFTTHPTAQTLSIGDPLTLTASASGAPTPSYQWYKDDVIIDGATGSTYSIASVVTGNAGSYKVVATNAVDSATSNAAIVTVGSVVLSPYETWADAENLTVGFDDGASQDPDKDGVVNLLEFALGGTPLSAASAPAPVLARNGANLTLTFDVKTVALTQFDVSAELTSDLVTWATAVHGTSGVTIVSTPLDGSTNRVVVTFPAGPARTFARVRVSPIATP